jgi:hypothetical protein
MMACFCSFMRSIDDTNEDLSCGLLVGADQEEVGRAKYLRSYQNGDTSLGLCKQLVTGNQLAEP